MQERNLCSQSNPYRYLCRQGMLHINKKEIEGPDMKILSMQKKSMKMIILLILSLFTGNHYKNIKNWNLFIPTKHLAVLMNSFKCVCAFQIKLEFGSVGFWGKAKTRVTGEKPLAVRKGTNNKLNPHTCTCMASMPKFEPRPQWWEVSALTTTPPLLPVIGSRS